MAEPVAAISSASNVSTKLNPKHPLWGIFRFVWHLSVLVVTFLLLEQDGVGELSATAVTIALHVLLSIRHSVADSRFILASAHGDPRSLILNEVNERIRAEHAEAEIQRLQAEVLTLQESMRGLTGR